MKILMVNKFHYIKGGSETYYFALKRMLVENGHTVIDFSMEDEKNFDSEYSRYFVEGVDYNGEMSALKKIKTAINIIYSKEAKSKFEELVKATKPDVVHLHIFQHQLSPSILDVIKKYNIPTVYTAHDLKMLCLNYVMMTNGDICEKCKGGKYINCLKNKCVKNSTAKSVINTIEGYVHKWRKSYNQIDYIITPSRFYREKFIEFGVNEDRVYHLANFLDTKRPKIEQCEKETYFLYFGRLSREKGILTLINAIKGTEEKLYIVGSGPLKDKIEELLKSESIENVKMLGFKSGKELSDIVGNARAVVLPSEWYENGPYSAIESLQLGRPIIGSRIGGIPELILENGESFEHKDVQALRKIILNFPKSGTKEYEDMCRKSEEIFENTYTKECHYDKLMSIYMKAIEKRKSGEKR